mmetsp:Transcript_1867/g.2688  ORF Transcript_1867/g.2688 Transcript_1867/m.2688 type:complete len:156 (-) Transcript_1867:532-999(-)
MCDHISIPNIKDFWTTKCTRCPQALDDLNSLAEMPEYENVRFTSIVLSTAEEEGCDSARNILEAPDDSPRWNSISHYHMDLENKEVAKKELGFTQVPFYVVLNEKGDIVQKGSKAQVNFKEIAGLHELEEESKVADNEETGFPPQERIFCLDDDF